VNRLGPGRPKTRSLYLEKVSTSLTHTKPSKALKQSAAFCSTARRAALPHRHDGSQYTAPVVRVQLLLRARKVLLRASYLWLQPALRHVVYSTLLQHVVPERDAACRSGCTVPRTTPASRPGSNRVPGTSAEWLTVSGTGPLAGCIARARSRIVRTWSVGCFRIFRTIRCRIVRRPRVWGCT
jgi:hypothetical protein